MYVANYASGQTCSYALDIGSGGGRAFASFGATNLRASDTGLLHPCGTPPSALCWSWPHLSPPPPHHHTRAPVALMSSERVELVHLHMYSCCCCMCGSAPHSSLCLSVGVRRIVSWRLVPAIWVRNHGLCQHVARVVPVLCQCCAVVSAAHCVILLGNRHIHVALPSPSPSLYPPAHLPFPAPPPQLTNAVVQGSGRYLYITFSTGPTVASTLYMLMVTFGSSPPINTGVLRCCWSAYAVALQWVDAHVRVEQQAVVRVRVVVTLVR